MKGGNAVKLVLRPRHPDRLHTMKLVLPDGRRMEVVLDKPEVRVL